MFVHTDWLLTAERAAIHRTTRTAVIADLHLGYSRARCRRGDSVPGTDLDETIAALAPVLDRPEVRRLVIAGDLLEDDAGCALLPELLEWLGGSGVELVGVVPGNHDRSLRQHAASMPLYPEGIVLGGWRVVHGDGSWPRGRHVCGHFHPCLRWQDRVAAPCYLVGARRLVLPAFSADAAGVNVLHDRRWHSYRCCVLTSRDVLDFGKLATLPRRIKCGVRNAECGVRSC
jgi:putative SbcD/Mre11-related phosphoesterase